MNHAAVTRATAAPLLARSAPRRLADVLVGTLIDAGVEVIFNLPGGPIGPVLDAVMQRRELRSVTVRHEAEAVFAAAGYAFATQKLAVVAVTSGPGVLNAVTGLASAYCDGLPVLILAGEVPRARFGRNALQDGSAAGLDIVAMARSFAKLSVQAGEPDSVPALIRHAIETATSGRPGPVLVTLPIDVVTTPVRSQLIAMKPRIDFDLDESVLREAADALANSKRGALFVGSGARWGHGPERVRELAERLQLPVMTTPKAKGVFPEDHPLSLGVFGWGGHPTASDYLHEGTDVLVTIGTGLSEAATNGWSSLLTPSNHFIQIDAEARQLGRNFPFTIGLVGTVERVTSELLDRVGPARRQTLRYGVKRDGPGSEVSVGPEGRLAPQRALWEIQRVMPANTLYSVDMGEHTLFAIHHLEVREPRGFALMMGLGSMGSGIGAALGLKLARPDHPVVCVCGDGGLVMSLGDVATVARERIPVIIAVMNDERYGMVEIGDTVVYGRTPGYAAGPVSVPELARALGAQGVTISNPGDILGLDLRGMLETGPVVLDVRIDRSLHISRARLEFLKKAARGNEPKPTVN